MADTDILVPGQEIYFPFTYDGVFSSGLETDHAYLTEQAKLIKYMTWGVFYYRLQMPSIQNLVYLYNILYNLPFAYEPGIVSISGLEATIGDYTYYLPSGESWGMGNGETVTRFQPLVSGIEIKDRVSNPAEIIAEFGEIKDANSFILEVSPLANSYYDSDFISRYEENFLDAAFNIKTTLI
jgi:hypothetical protein